MMSNLVEYINTPWVMAVIALVVVLLVALPLVLYFRKDQDTKLMNKLFKQHCQAFEKDVVIPDGIDGFLFVDYLMLIRGKIIALKIFPRRGYIFGAEKIDEWTCVDNNRTEKFNNPLVNMSLFTQAINNALGSDVIEGYVVFGSHSVFPKGLPHGVLQMKDFKTTFEQIQSSDEACEAAHQTWEKIQALNALHAI